MTELHGGCHCRKLTVDVELPGPASAYSPRACDCDYCVAHGASYLTDPAGRLRLHVNDPSALGRYRQGSGTAEFLFCRECGVLVGVHHDGFAAVNSRVVPADYATAAVVSPKKLSVDEKTARWRQVWFPGFKI